MKELKELRFDGQRLVLKDNLVRSPILPKAHTELDRDIQVDGETVIQGAVFARNLEIAQGPLEVHGAVFTQGEIHVASDCRGTIEFRKAVGSASSVTSHSNNARLLFGADINAKQVNLRNAYVAANVFADEVVLENCVVLGGVFATKSLVLNNAITGTYSSPSVRLSQSLFLLLPSAFSVEPLSCLPGTKVKNLTLADLGALMRGVPECEMAGFIPLDPTQEEQKIVLSDEKGEIQVVRCLSVAGKVLAADLMDAEKLQNHFLLAAGAMGSQLLKTYSIGVDSQGNPVELTLKRLADFFFSILDGKIQIRQIDGRFELKDVMAGYQPPVATSSQAEASREGGVTDDSTK
jgi:hypothetical protein